jgi:hypothetical protein
MKISGLIYLISFLLAFTACKKESVEYIGDLQIQLKSQIGNEIYRS